MSYLEWSTQQEVQAESSLMQARRKWAWIPASHDCVWKCEARCVGRRTILLSSQNIENAHLLVSCDAPTEESNAEDERGWPSPELEQNNIHRTNKKPRATSPSPDERIYTRKITRHKITITDHSAHPHLVRTRWDELGLVSFEVLIFLGLGFGREMNGHERSTH